MKEEGGRGELLHPVEGQDVAGEGGGGDRSIQEGTARRTGMKPGLELMTSVIDSLSMSNINKR